MRITKKRRIWRIIVAAAAVFTLALTLISFDSPTMTGNAASLKHIDEIVAESGTFNILEIVPDTTAASFGYYIDGQEPISSAAFDTFIDGTVQVNGWKATLAKTTSPSERTSLINDLFSRLAAKGVLGDGATTPLKYTYFDGANYYTESYLVTDPQDWSKLHLQSTESITMNGTFSPVENDAYRAEYTYNPVTNGGYVQNVTEFSYTKPEQADSGTYYYNPTFLRISAGTDLTDTETMKWSTTTVYTELKDSYNTNITDSSNRNIYVVGQYKTVKEILDHGGFDASDDAPIKYYYVDPAQTGAPGSYSDANYYAAVVDRNDDDDTPGDGYLATTGTSYFSRSISSYTYVSTGGNYAYTADMAGSPNIVNFTDIYYKAGFVNNNLFKQYVLGLNSSTYNALNVTVTVRKASQVSASDISTAGMIYIATGTDITKSGVATSYTVEDIPDARAVDLYNYAADQNPVIIDYPIIAGITEATPGDQINNIQKLCLLSMETAMTPTTETSLSGLSVNWADLAYMTSDADKTFVNNNIYCFNAFNTVSTTNIPNPVSPGTGDIFTIVSALYNEAFSANVYTSGFSAVLAEIQNENFLKQIAGETSLLPENVTISASVRHIINFRGQRQTNPKTSIKVLDLEPAKVTSASPSYLTPEMVRGWIDNSLTEDQITIVHMTTAEFIGKIEDINETYDMIYIGMSTETMNTSSGNTVYNDSAMNGLIYSNIGDIYNGSLELSGIRSQDYVYVDGTKAINGATGTTANQFRFSGNDITAAKVSELGKYARAGYPIILADSFIAGSGVNTAKVDSSSYMYSAVSNIYGTYSNVMTQTYAASISNADTVIKYLNVSKPSVNVTTKPVEYADDSSAAIAVDPNDGYYYLKYIFSISNVTDPTPVSTTYDTWVFIDLNADGRYSDNERLNDIEVHRVSDGALILPLTDVNGVEYYTLSADIEYQVTRQMPDSYVGIIPWKLEVIKNGADQIHASAQGYTRIAPGSQVQTIKVLQIMQAGTSSTKLNLAQQLVVNPSGTNLQLKGMDGKFYTGIYGKLIADLADFSVSIDTVETNVLEAKGDTTIIQSYLNGYDMLVIGFNDCYDGIKANSAAAIVSYINSGKSVLFTHDTTSLSQVPTSNFPMAISATPTTKTLSGTNVLWNANTSEYKSIDGKINWKGDYLSTAPANIRQYGPTYIVLMSTNVTTTNEQDYYNAKVDSYYMLSGSTYSAYAYPSSYNEFKTATASGTVIYVRCSAVSGWYGTGSYSDRWDLSTTSNFTKFSGGTKYTCVGLTYRDSVGYKPWSKYSDLKITDYAQIMKCLFNDATPDNYNMIGTYNQSANTYSLSGVTWYPATGATFPQSTLYASDPSQSLTLGTIPSGISDWGYYFNTIIRDAVGLDRYGVTSSIPISDTQTLGSIVDVNAPMTSTNISTILDYSRSVAFAPKSAKGSTVNEYQGYTNYALIRFAGSGNTYKYTNNNYYNRETTNVSQVNKGQITTYPYNVNSASFGGNDSTIIGYGDSYMKIGKTHEQYFQINMNTEDIVVWYCMSSGGTDDNSYYDDVPNDSVNAYYIYNKGNVTYSGVGHSSNASLYTGTSIAQEYINEAKLFVNTMIAAYQSAAQAPNIAIKKDARGTSDLNDKFMLTDNASVLSVDLSPTDESRAVYYRISDPNVGVNKTITVQYYVADGSGTTVTGISEPVLPLLPDGSTEPLTTYNSNGIAVPMTDNNGVLETRLKGGYVYKLYLPFTDCLEKLTDDNIYSVRIYVKVTTMIGITPMTPAVDSIEIKKQELFELS